VLDPDVAELGDEAPAGAQQLEDGRHGPRGDAVLAAGADHLGAQCAGRRRDRQHHLVGLDVLEDLAELVGGAEHLDVALQPRALLVRVVVDEADRPV
ncbi:MAG: hypothetical protein AVDCRST_MAG65-2276, partial [uncultured Solirubrobacteraceae bacterium]